MDNSQPSGSYASHVSPPPPPPLGAGFSQKRTSYRRPIEPQPAVAQNPEQGDYFGAVPSNSARAVAPAGPPPPNGVGRVSSQRRRPVASPQGPRAEPLLPAPDAPRGPPPTSYRNPYTKGSSRRSSSGRPRDPTIQTIPRQQPNIQSPNLPNIQIAPERLHTPADQATLNALEGKSRRPSVPDRSPLQKLEGKLDDISKEERRNRMQELELEAQERIEAEARARRAVEAAVKQQQRTFSGPLASPGKAVNAPGRSPSGRRHVSMPIHTKPQPQDVPSDSDDGVLYDLSEPWDPSGGANAASPYGQPPPLPSSASQPQRTRESYADSAIGRTPSVKGKEPVGVNRGSGSFRNRTVVPEQTSPNVRRKPVGSPSGLGLYDVPNTPQAEITRRDSKRVSKDLPQTPRDPAADRRRDSRGIMAAQMEMERHRLDYKNENTRGAAQPPAPSYDAPPAQRRSVGFASTTDATMSRETHRQSNVPDVFSHDGGPERRYQAPPMLQEWKEAPIAALASEDLDLDALEGADPPSKAWWEESGSRRRRSGSYTTTQPGYDGYLDEPSGQTSFNPPLYLKCGPLLRYTGMRKDKSRPGKIREIWRGSIMIVTLDSRSQYAKPPTLRIFKQPMEVLPPPPDEVEDGPLNPAWVDPLEGQIKMSRSGKTLYVKPIDEIAENVDLSRVEDDSGLFQATRITNHHNSGSPQKPSRFQKKDGEKLGKVREIPGIRLHAERGVTFWRFNIEIELGATQQRIAYRVNRGPAIGFWVPARGETMNIMFHSCNGFSYSVDPREFCGPDPMWRDVLNCHQTRPFHVMIGGGDQIYNDAAMRETTLFRQWTESRNPLQKHRASFSAELQNELEQFYLDRYSMWFSQGLFGMANCQIPMVNMWDDHDIIDGFGSYPHHFMSTPVFTGIGAVAHKYYMLFQHQSVVTETTKTEPSWLLGAHPGPYIKEHSRSVFMFLGKQVAFLGLDCRTERRRDEILTEDSYDIIFDRLEDEIVKGETKHLIVLLGVPIAYPRLNFLENVLTSRLMDPIKAVGRAGLLGNFVNKFDGGVEILDDLDDHWTAKHHKEERNWFIRELQHVASTKGVRVTILGGDVHLAAVGQFYSNKKLKIPKEKDHRYMPNVISSAIVNTPPPDLMADVLNKRNKVHHLDASTDEDMVALFADDVDEKKRNNTHLLPRRNWCSLREYKPGATPPATPTPPPQGLRMSRTLSDLAPGNMVRRMSEQGRRGRDRAPPVSYYNNPAYANADEGQAGVHSSFSPDREERPRSRRSSLSSLFRRRASVDGTRDAGSAQSLPVANKRNSFARDDSRSVERPSPFHRRSSVMSRKGLKGEGDTFINFEGGLDVCLHVEVNQHDPAGITCPYRLLVPALHMDPEEAIQPTVEKEHRKSRIGSIFGALGGGRRRKSTIGDDGYSQSGSSIRSRSESIGEVDEEEERARQRYKVGPRILIPGFSKRRRSSASAVPAHADTSDSYNMSTTQETRNFSAPYATAGAQQQPISPQQISAADKRISAPVEAAYNPTPALPAHSPSVPTRSGSTRQPLTHNSSHKSQLPAAPAQAPEQKVYRRSMGGILNHEPDEFSNQRHSHGHSRSLSHAHTHNAAHNAAHSSHHQHHHHHHHHQQQQQQQQRRHSKRESYPPHPAIVGAGPNSPYSRGSGGGVEPRDEHRNSSGGGYFVRNPLGQAPPVPSFNPGMGAGVGARYLGGGRYADDDLSDDDLSGEERAVGAGGGAGAGAGRYAHYDDVSDMSDEGGAYRRSGAEAGGPGIKRYYSDAGRKGKANRVLGGDGGAGQGYGPDAGGSQDSFVPPKGKSKWKIWK